tara:strand:- start:4909 stop:5151 length:243 start_codon:yes stop_codon:yes gene_type:complete
MITNLIRFTLFTVIVISFICLYDFEFLIKESMKVKESSSISELPVENKLSSSEKLKKWIEEEKGLENNNPTSTKISELSI